MRGGDERGGEKKRGENRRGEKQRGEKRRGENREERRGPQRGADLRGWPGDVEEKRVEAESEHAEDGEGLECNGSRVFGRGGPLVLASVV